MPDLNNLFDAFYTRFVLKDFFGKIIPGLLLLFASAVLLLPSNNIMSDLGKIPVWGWLIIYGFGWIVGFAIQALGEITHLITYSPNVDKNILIWMVDNKLRFKFNEVAVPYEKQYIERMSIIKESCGNAYVALLGFILLLFLSKFKILWACNLEGIRLSCVLVELTCIALFLCHMHFEHVYRHYVVIFNVLSEKKGFEDDVKSLKDRLDKYKKTSVFKKFLTYVPAYVFLLVSLFICVAYLYKSYISPLIQ